MRDNMDKKMRAKMCRKMYIIFIRHPEVSASAGAEGRALRETAVPLQ